MADITFDELLQLADKLSPFDQARLLSHLATRMPTLLGSVAMFPKTITQTGEQRQSGGWERFNAVIEDFHATYPDGPPVTDEQENEQQAREEARRGIREEKLVHA